MGLADAIAAMANSSSVSLIVEYMMTGRSIEEMGSRYEEGNDTKYYEEFVEAGQDRLL